MIDPDLFRKAFSVAAGAVSGALIALGILFTVARQAQRLLDWWLP